MKLVEKQILPIRDLSDFCGNWTILRESVSDTNLASLAIPEDMYRTIVWMRRLTEITCVFPPPYPVEKVATAIPAE